MGSFENWLEEKKSAYLYKVLSDKESNATRKQLFLELSKKAEEQALIWQNSDTSTSFHFKPDIRTRLLSQLIKRFDPKKILPILAAAKVRGISVYTHSMGHHIKPKTIEDVGVSHTALSSGGNLRAAVFGVNDGLISNASLIMGMAGATQNSTLIVLTGTAGLIAGAFSMASGEYISVKSQRELYEHQIGLERAELEQYPEEEAAELSIIYQARGLDKKDADYLSNKLISDFDTALDTLAREELGLNPNELSSPVGAAIFSFLFFALGAILPLLPFLFSSGMQAFYLSLTVVATSLFLVGSIISLFTGNSFYIGGSRMLLLGTSAMAVTYLIGKMLGVSIS